jgi:hypothetical protein
MSAISARIRVQARSKKRVRLSEQAKVDQVTNILIF